MAVGFSAVTYALCKRATSAEIKKAIEGLSEGMKFKGSVATIEDLPEQHESGDLYLVRDEGAKAVWDGEQWVIFDHALKVKDGSLTISDNKIGVNISTEVGNNLQLKEDGLYVPVEGAIGITFVTDITVGHLKAGTRIRETDRISDILYKMLYTPSTETIMFYYGATYDIPASVNELESIEKNISEILARKVVQNVKTGDINDVNRGQYPVFAIEKKPGFNIRLEQWSAQGAETIPIPFITIDGDDNYIYYIGTKTYDVDLGGTNYILTFKEGE